MKKSELLARIEALEARVRMLEARPHMWSPSPGIMSPTIWPTTAPPYVPQPIIVTCDTVREIPAQCSDGIHWSS